MDDIPGFDDTNIDDDDVLTQRERDKLDSILRVLRYIDDNPDKYRVTVLGYSGGFVIEDNEKRISVYMYDEVGWTDTVYISFKHMANMKLVGTANHIIKVKEDGGYPMGIEIVRIEPASFWEIGV